MTEGPRAARARTGLAAARACWLAATLVFVVLLALLGWRMASGADPSLGSGRSAAAVAPAPLPRRVLIRRIERKVVITRVLPPRRPRIVAQPVSAVPAAAGAAPAYVPPQPQRAAYVPPQRPAYVPPAPAPAPPPPPPVVTRQS